MTFTGFGAQALPFFKALAFHQSKEWFDANRAIYDTEVKAPYVALIEALAGRFAAAGIPLTGSARSSLFRLNRDIRFSKDKSPYKTHGGAVMSRTGTKADQGFLYIHLDPKGCFAAAAFYHPEPAETGNLRRAIRRDPLAWRKMVADLESEGLSLEPGEPLSRTPRGFEDVADDDLIAAIRKRSLIVRHPLPDALMQSADLPAAIESFVRRVRPFFDWGWSAIVDSRP